ncbi:hypothetical protein BJV82DRAFT_663144 [Fennellomyces sp. T-0311]|nr:hypothetical protein BJV82DRAFT_663144 [Fennellomyces sp. T-0311]
MDIGKRPSRQRRHLPIAFEPEKKSKKEQEPIQNDIYDDEQFMQRSSSRCSDWAGNLRRRRKTRPSVEVTAPRTAVEQGIVKEHRHQPTVQVLIWISCGGWALFLLVRIVYSVWLGDYGQLNVVHFLTH